MLVQQGNHEVDIKTRRLYEAKKNEMKFNRMRRLAKKLRQ